jgi:SAM-dependent methyltransferase
MGSEHGYVLADSEAAAESRRLAALEVDSDPDTVRRLDRLAVGAGWRCLEVGAGRGSIARWLGERVGPDGRVVAADIDCRFLIDLPGNVEVRTLDICKDSPEAGAYDLVHCRALLMHVPDPGAVLSRMVASLRRGGVLLAEDGDFGLLTYGGHPDGPACTEATHRVLDALRSSGRMNAFLGRNLPTLLLNAGLDLMGGEVKTVIARPGTPPYELWRLSMHDMAPMLTAAGLMSEADAARTREVLADPRTVLTSLTMVSAWGRRPG